MEQDMEKSESNIIPPNIMDIYIVYKELGGAPVS
jgi:hypothetical protein